MPNFWYFTFTDKRKLAWYSSHLVIKKNTIHDLMNIQADIIGKNVIVLYVCLVVDYADTVPAKSLTH